VSDVRMKQRDHRRASRRAAGFSKTGYP
jgi:hypothetical protein